jgi:hypothetical protein
VDEERIENIRAKLTELSTAILLRIKATPPSNDVVAACWNVIQKRAINSLNSLMVLVEHAHHNYLHDGASILRGLYDTHLQALYILRDPEVRAKLYCDFLFIQTYELLKAADKNLSDIGEAVRSSLYRPYFVQNVATNYAAVRTQFLTNRGDKCRENWYRGTLADIAKEVGHLAEYELMQRNLSNSHHSTPLGLLQGAGVTPDILLNYAWSINLRIIGAMADYIGLELDEMEKVAVVISRRSLCDFPH